MKKQKELIKGLNELKLGLSTLVGHLQSTGTIDETIESLTVLAPIETVIDKALKKVSNTRNIPKQSTIKQIRS